MKDPDGRRGGNMRKRDPDTPPSVIAQPFQPPSTHSIPITSSSYTTNYLRVFTC
jgi:hypothetical protein